MNSLTFEQLRKANIERLPQFKNGKNETAHAKADGSDWSLNDWLTAVAGEVGEAANLLKKVRRGDFTLEEKKQDIAKELADVVIYLDILAKQMDIDLGEAIRSKFNEVSNRIKCDVKL